MKIDPAFREKQSLLFLDQFPWEVGCVIIGGYAILGYGALRYSRDLDILIPLRLSEKIKGWFTEKEFSVEKTATPNPQNYDGRYVRYLKSELTIDLLIGAVRDREAQVDIPESWISKQPTMRKIIGLNGSTKTELPLVRLEALWALKIQAGRSQDISDLFSIFNMKFSKDEVITIFREHLCDSLREKLSKTRGKLKENKIYQDLRSALFLKDTTKVQAQWKQFVNTMEQIIDAILTE